MHSKGVPEEICKKIGWSRVSYHLFRKETGNLCFPQKKKKREAKKNQIKIKSQKIGKNVMNIVQFSIALHCCIQSLHSLLFKIKVACICIPNIMFILGYRFLFVYQFPKSNALSFEFRMRGPLKESTSWLSHKVKPFGTSTYWLAS